MREGGGRKNTYVMCVDSLFAYFGFVRVAPINPSSEKAVIKCGWHILVRVVNWIQKKKKITSQIYITRQRVLFYPSWYIDIKQYIILVLNPCVPLEYITYQINMHYGLHTQREREKRERCLGVREYILAGSERAMVCVRGVRSARWFPGCPFKRVQLSFDTFKRVDLDDFACQVARQPSRKAPD